MAENITCGNWWRNSRLSEPSTYLQFWQTLQQHPHKSVCLQLEALPTGILLRFQSTLEQLLYIYFVSLTGKGSSNFEMVYCRLAGEAGFLSDRTTVGATDVMELFSTKKKNRQSLETRCWPGVNLAIIHHFNSTVTHIVGGSVRAWATCCSAESCATCWTCEVPAVELGCISWPLR